MIRSRDCEEVAMRIAKLLENSVSIEDAIEVLDLDSSGKEVRFTATPRTLSAARKVHRAANTEQHVSAVCEILKGLPTREAKKILSAVRKKLEQEVKGSTE